MTDDENIKLAFEALPDTILLCDGSGKIFYCNPQSFQLLGYSPEQLIDQHVEILVPEQYRHAHIKLRENYTADPWHRNMENITHLKAVKQDGSLVPVTIALSPITLANEQHIIVAIRNNSSFIRAGQMAREQHDQAMQKQSRESLGLFSMGIAHDMKNLLNIVTGNAELLLNEVPNDPTVIRKLDAIMSASGQLLYLSKQILTFAGGSQPEKQEIAVSQIIQDMVELIKITLPKNIRVECKFMDEKVILKADPSELTQTMLNLILNASEAISTKTGKITVTTAIKNTGMPSSAEQEISSVIKQGPYFCITVSDNGQGIPPDQLKSIFDPFYSTKAHGKGLGLAVVSGIAKSHHGFININSEIGQGTSICICFPDFIIDTTAAQNDEPGSFKKTTS